MSPFPRAALVLAALTGLTACSEYGLAKPPEGVDEPTPDTGSPPPEDTGEVVDSDPMETGQAVDEVDPVPCDQVQLESLQWWGSQPLTTEATPTDGGGRAFYDAGFDLAGWSTVVLPDSGHTPAGTDRAYRGTFTLSEVPDAVYIDVQSDDGIWLWVNGVAIGHWGGAWQEEGCVNDEARCLVTTTVDPTEVTSALVAGENVVAARVSNAVDQAYFQLHALCAPE